MQSVAAGVTVATVAVAATVFGGSRGK
jgi:hypothetical protein